MNEPNKKPQKPLQELRELEQEIKSFGKDILNIKDKTEVLEKESSDALDSSIASVSEK